MEEKEDKIIDKKIAMGKLNKFISEKYTFKQVDYRPKKKVKDIIKELAAKEKIMCKKICKI